jgi:NADH oxidase (H2O2-forming)
LGREAGSPPSMGRSRRERKKRVLVIGGGVAGVAAARASADGGAETTLVESSKRVGVSRSRLPLIIADGLTEDDLVAHTAESLERAGIDLMIGVSVRSVVRKEARESARPHSSNPSSPSSFRVETSDSHLRSMEFDSVVVCTGTTRLSPQTRGISKEGVFVLSEAPDYLRLSARLSELRAVAVTGPIPLSLKLGELLALDGKRVEIYCGEKGLEKQFPISIAEEIRRRASRGLGKEGSGVVSLIDGQIDSILGVDRAEAIVSGGSVRVCDAVVVIPHSVPSFPLADCQKGGGGGLLVDAGMCTSQPDLFAAGDCAEFRFRSGSLPARLHSTSKLGGEVAGINASGGRAAASPAWAVQQKYFGLEYCSAGLGEQEREEVTAGGLDGGIEVGEFVVDGDGGGGPPAVRETAVAATTRPIGLHDNKTTFVSLVFDRATRQVYGIQVAGWLASSLSSAASLIVATGMTVEQLSYAEFAYSPGSTYEDSPIALTARRIHRRERLT